MRNNLTALSADSISNINELVKASPNARWCVWVKKQREHGKTAKIPHAVIKSQLRALGTDDVTGWVDFATACQWLENGHGHGVGILIGSKQNADDKTYQSGLVAVDIDGCLNSDGSLVTQLNGDIKQAIKMMQNAGVYMEISPSGSGLRAFWIGDKPTGINQKASIDGHSCEMYDSVTGGRFVTVTGQMFTGQAANISAQDDVFTKDVAEYLGLLSHESKDTSSPIRNLAPLSDDELIQKLKQSAQGKANKLFKGNLSAYGNDHSSADAALCGYIAKHTDDAAQVERVWGLSELAKRDKFKRDDYRERTIKLALESARALTSTKATAESRQKELISSALLSADNDDGVLADIVAGWGGKVPKTLGAAEKIISLDKRLAGAIAFDEFSSQVLKLRSLHSCLGDVVPKDRNPELGQTWADTDTLCLTVGLESLWGLVFRPAQVHEAVDVAARRVTINPVVNVLNDLVWDGIKRLDSMLVQYFNADDSYDTPRYLAAIGRAWMIGTVARAYKPGCKHDHILTLEGGQGVGKSKALRTLTSAVAPHTFREGLPPLSMGEEAPRALRGIWICELAEMAFMDRVTSEQVKAFTTKEADSFREPFGRRAITVPRTVSFAATTNQNEFVKDIEARRYWSFKVTGPIDIATLVHVAKQLWAEAVAAFKAGESWWITDAAVLMDARKSQGERLERSGFDDLINEKIIAALAAGKLSVSDYREQALHLWQHVMGKDKDIEFHKNSKAFAGALVRSGFEKKTISGKSIWFVGKELAAMIRRQQAI